MVRRVEANPVAEIEISSLSPLRFLNSNVPSALVVAWNSEEPCFRVTIALLMAA
jgi:hypothetical protein